MFKILVGKVSPLHPVLDTPMDLLGSTPGGLKNNKQNNTRTEQTRTKKCETKLPIRDAGTTLKFGGKRLLESKVTATQN